MKCIKCRTVNINNANYCKKCGYHFSKSEQNVAKRKTLVGKIEYFEKIKSYVTLSKITGNTIFKIASLLIVILPVIFFYFSHGGNVKIEKSKDYKIEQNTKTEEYYLLVKEDVATLNLYVPNDVKKLTIIEKNNKDEILETYDYNKNKKVLLYASNENGYYELKATYDSKEKSNDKFKIYVYRMDD